MKSISQLLCLLLFVFVSIGAVADWSDEYFCALETVKNGKCREGDLLGLPSPIIAIRYCDFSKEVVTATKGDASDIDSWVICYYSGKERKRRE